MEAVTANGVDGLRAEIWRLASRTELSDVELMQQLLDTVGPAVGVDRACYNCRDGEVLRTTVEWRAPGIAATVGTEIPEPLAAPFLAGEALELTPAGTLAYLPEPMRTENASFYAILSESQDIESVLIMPYRVDGRLEGALSFDQCHPVPAGWSLSLRPIIAELVQIVAQVIARQRAAAASRESERRYRELAEWLPLLLVETDATGTITYANSRAFEVSRYTPADLRAGVRLQDLVQPERHGLVRERLAAVLAGGTAGREHEIFRKDGTPLWVQVWAGPIVRDSRIVGIRCVAMDITERRQAEAERRELEARITHTQKLESLGLLAGGVAHDFNNLLVTILGNAQLELVDPERSAASRRRLQKIVDGAKRATELAALMLAYAGGARCQPERVDLTHIVREVVDVMQSVVARTAKVDLELAPGLPPVEADPTQLRQIVMNLFLNASEALGDQPGAIRVRTKAASHGAAPPGAVELERGPANGPLLALEVEDDGCGMDEATIARIFDPFFSTKFLGRGLGLAAVMGIVRQHRGTIQVRSAPGQGTMMRVLLPTVA